MVAQFVVRLCVTAMIALLNLAATGAEVLYVGDYDAARIESYDVATGIRLGTFATSGVRGPHGMAFDRATNLFVSDHYANFV
jgi:hypothetical protein